MMCGTATIDKNDFIQFWAISILSKRFFFRDQICNLLVNRSYMFSFPRVARWIEIFYLQIRID